MTEQNSSEHQIVSIPWWMYEQMALCYYGGGPRHRLSVLKEPEAPHEPSAVNENPQEIELDAVREKTRPSPHWTQMGGDPLANAKPMGFAAKRARKMQGDAVSSDKNDSPEKVETGDATATQRANTTPDEEA